MPLYSKFIFFIYATIFIYIYIYVYYSVICLRHLISKKRNDTLLSVVFFCFRVFIYIIYTIHFWYLYNI